MKFPKEKRSKLLQDVKTLLPYYLGRVPVLEWKEADFFDFYHSLLINRQWAGYWPGPYVTLPNAGKLSNTEISGRIFRNDKGRVLQQNERYSRMFEGLTDNNIRTAIKWAIKEAYKDNEEPAYYYNIPNQMYYHQVDYWVSLVCERYTLRIKTKKGQFWTYRYFWDTATHELLIKLFRHLWPNLPVWISQLHQRNYRNRKGTPLLLWAGNTYQHGEYNLYCV